MSFTSRLLIILCMVTVAYAKAPANFPQAKKIAAQIFNDKRETLYCGCKYNAKKQVDLAGCHMQKASIIKRAHRMEWEHMMPAEHFGRHFKCWREPICSKHGKPYKGRPCCEKVDADFRKAEAELYNLWPAVGVINQLRSNYRYSPLSHKHLTYGCDFTADRSLRKAEPPARVKGLVARANLFMAEKYHVRLSKAQRKLFEVWNKEHPPGDWEKEWARRVAKIEGYPNPYILSHAR
ncbi:endonuclease [Legionella israelensis]|nr:endonuclease [Legionella israelensis]QBS08992.1 deoxyribonuclease [Legionella israelensis]